MGDLLVFAFGEKLVHVEAGDTVDLAGTWNDGAVAGDYQTYTRGAATILIDTDIFVT